MSETTETNRNTSQTAQATRLQSAEPTFPPPRSDLEEIDAAREALSESILDIARWRRAKADHSPDETRNLPAAELLEQIAETVAEVPDSLIRQYAEAWHEPIAFRTSEAQSVLLRDIGFRSATDNATKLLEHLMDHVADARQDLAQG